MIATKAGKIPTQERIFATIARIIQALVKSSKMTVNSQA
jgi:GTP cyclohydrolase I